MKYRILWKRKGEEKACGWGKPIFDKYEIADHFAEELNRKYSNLYHWVEPVRDAEQPTEGQNGRRRKTG